MTQTRLLIATSFLVAAVLVGCGTSPEPRFYTLSAGESPGSDSNKKAVAEYSVAVGPVTVPEIVDRPELVVRAAVNRVALVEQHRWAEPLRNEIAHVVAENLEQLLGAKQVVAYSQNGSQQAEYQVLLDIQRFESALGQAVIIDALWTVRRHSGGEPKAGRSVAREPSGRDGYDALVAAHSRALAAVSREIAEAIRATVMRSN